MILFAATDFIKSCIYSTYFFFKQFLLLSEGIRREKLFIIGLKIDSVHYTNLFDSILVLQTNILFCIRIAYFFSNYAYKKRKPCITTFNAMTSLNILAWSSYRLRLHINFKDKQLQKDIFQKKVMYIYLYNNGFLDLRYNCCMIHLYVHMSHCSLEDRD